MSESPAAIPATSPGRSLGVTLLRVVFALLLRATLMVTGTVTIFSVLMILVLGSPRGSAWLIESLTEFAGERLVVSGAHGTLLAGVEIDSLIIKAGRTTLRVEPATLRMNWPDLLRWRVRLTTARADAVYIDVAPRPPDEVATPVKALVLPVTIAIDALEVQKLVIRTPGLAADAEPVEIGPLALRAEFVRGELRFSSLKVALYGVETEASGTFGSGEPFALDAQLAWRIPGRELSGAGPLTGNLERLRFEQVVRVPTPLGVGGVARLFGDQPQVFAEARWTALERPLGDSPEQVLHSNGGRLRVRGWTERIVAELSSGVRLGDWPTAEARVVAEGDARELELKTIELAGFGGRVSGTGRITIGPTAGDPEVSAGTIAGTLALQGEQIDPGFLDPRLAGSVNFLAAVGFDSTGNYDVQVPDADGTVYGRPLQASGGIARVAQVLRFDDVKVRTGANRVAFSGQWGGQQGKGIDGKASIDAPDLATLWPGLDGELRGTATVGGSVAKPEFNVDLTGRKLAWDALRADSLTVRGGLLAGNRLEVDVEAGALLWAGEPLGDLVASVAGPLDNHTAKIALTGGDIGVRLEAAGGWQDGVLTERIETARVALPGSQPWALREPATAQLKGSDMAVTDHCWTSGGSEMCLAEARASGSDFSAALEARRFPLTSLSPWLPADVGLGGLASATIAVRRDAGRLSGSLDGLLADGTITWQVPDDEAVQTTISELRVKVGLNNDALDFEAAVEEGFGLRLTATGTVSQPFGDAPLISARIGGGVPDLAALGPVIERVVDVGDLAGRITVDVTLSGNAWRPDIAGGVKLTDGALTVPAAGIRVDRITLALLGRDDGQLALEGGARSGKGFAALAGSVAWRDQLLPSAEATVKGRLIEVIKLPQGVVLVSPDVRVVLRDGQFRVSGEMLVPRAEIKLKKLEESAAQTSADTVVHGRDLVVVEKKPPLFVLDGLQVRLGEKVTFDGFGLKTELAGGLRLSQSVGAEPGLVTASGVVSLRRGQFTAFGQKLAIDRGSLLFSGLVTNPGLDVRASREMDYQGRDITVGVLLSGKLSRIETKLFSEPAMGDLDALSYLTTGKPLSAAGAGDRDAVANAAIGLGLNQALPVVQQLGSALSVDQIGLDTTKDGGTAVVVGEQLGKDLFIRYSYGVFDQLGTVIATYKLGKRMSIEGSSGEEQSIDLIYSINW